MANYASLAEEGVTAVTEGVTTKNFDFWKSYNSRPGYLK